jgi:hypothetical protein
VPNAVTSFTFSEFARTPELERGWHRPRWGGIQFAVGGSVIGKKLYSAPMASGHAYFPDLTLDGPDCLSRGR